MAVQVRACLCGGLGYSCGSSAVDMSECVDQVLALACVTDDAAPCMYAYTRGGLHVLMPAMQCAFLAPSCTLPLTSCSPLVY